MFIFCNQHILCISLLEWNQEIQILQPLVANQTSFNLYLEVTAAAAKYVQLVFVTSNLVLIIFLQNFFIESPGMNDTTNMCQALWCLCIL